MTMSTLKNFLVTTRALLTNTKSLALFAALYALLLATLYFYVATREATVWQVAITLLGLVVIPAEFFVFQAAIIDHAQQTKGQWRGILLDAIKFFVITIPILILGYVLWILLNKWQVHYPLPRPEITSLIQSSVNKARPLHWPTLLFATLRCLLFGIMLPLAAIHLWIAIAGQDLKSFPKRIGASFARAFSSGSVLTYALGLIVFVAIPYAVLFLPLTIKGNKTEFTVFILRLVLVFVFTLIGWVITLQALARNTPPATEARPSVVPDVSQPITAPQSS
jgi:hypothetical protein